MFMIKKVYRGGSKESYLVVLPKFWVKIHGIDKKREVNMIIETDKIIIMPPFEKNGLDKNKGFDNKP